MTLGMPTLGSNIAALPCRSPARHEGLTENQCTTRRFVFFPSSKFIHIIHIFRTSLLFSRLTRVSLLPLPLPLSSKRRSILQKASGFADYTLDVSMPDNYFPSPIMGNVTKECSGYCS